MDNGQDWKAVFINDLMNSKFFVRIISAAGLTRVRTPTADNSHENVLKEYQAAFYFGKTEIILILF